MTIDIPESLRSVHTAPLFVIQLNVIAMQMIGATPSGVRRIGIVSGGQFDGARLAGQVLDGGSDWQYLRADAVSLNVRLTLQTTDGALIGMTYSGLRHGTEETLARLDRGDRVDPSDYYFRITAAFETAAPTYDWLNRVLAVGIGDRRAHGPVYAMFEIL